MSAMTCLIVLLIVFAVLNPVPAKWNHDKIGYLEWQGLPMTNLNNDAFFCRKHFNMTDKQVLDQLLMPDKYDPHMRPQGSST